MNASETPAVVLCGDLNMLRCFAHHPAARIVVLGDARDPTRWSRHCTAFYTLPDPTLDPAGALTCLERIAIALSPKPVLYYGTDALLLLISRHRDRLSQHYTFLMPDRETIDLLVDKSAFARSARAHGIVAPQTILSTEYHPGLRVPLPCVLKPSRHIGWSKSRAVRSLGGRPRKALLAGTQEQFAQARALMEEAGYEYVIQEYIPGGDDAIFSFHALLDRRSEPLGYFVGRKIRTYPKTSGISTYIEVVRDEEVVRVGKDAVRKLGLVGIAKLDFKRHAQTGDLYLLEVNPRFNLWNYLGAFCGMNLPELAYDYLVGGSVQPRDDYRTGARWVSFADDARAFLREYRPAGDVGWLSWLRSLSEANVHDVFAWDDPCPFLVSLAQDVAEQARKRLRRAS